jgi:hypothetical protein
MRLNEPHKASFSDFQDKHLGGDVLDVLHLHQILHQELCLACQVHVVLEHNQHMDSGKASFVQLLCMTDSIMEMLLKIMPH